MIHRKRGFISAVAFMLMLGGIAESSAQQPPGANSITMASNKLAAGLYQHFTETHGNFVFSPASVYIALSMLEAGARGDTAAEIQAVLAGRNGVSSVIDGSFIDDLVTAYRSISERVSQDVQLSVANALWPQAGHPILESYLETMRRFDAEVTPLDFANAPDEALRHINQWAAEKTAGRIDPLLERLPQATILMLANAIYFLGNWQYQFDPSHTEPADFETGLAEEVQVDMMSQSQYLDYREFDTVEVLEMPFLGQNLLMAIILPLERGGLPRVEAGLDERVIEEWLASSWFYNVDVHVPRFTFKSDFKLVPALRSLGIETVFEQGAADLTGIDGVSGLLFLDNAIQKAFIQVNEEGAEAAAVTTGGCFPAGTLVHTVNGLMPIQEITPGDRVQSFDPGRGGWQMRAVTDVETQEYSGEMISATVAGERIYMTANHPVLVASGAGLTGRTAPGDIGAGPVQTAAGRWVEAGAMETGDTVLTRGVGAASAGALGRVAPVTALSRSTEIVQVYNLKVGATQTYCVGSAGIVVHNKGAEEPESAEFRANHPFIFLIRDVHTGLILFMGRVLHP